MGSSGCGKTTLISSLVGLINVDKGDIQLFGDKLNYKHTLRVGFMPQEAALVDSFKIKEIIWFFGRIFGLSKVKIEERFKFLSTLFELPDGDTIIKSCSGGQQRRISLALALVHEPELLILDEPTVGLDPLMRNTIWDFMTELTKTRKVTILMSTHYNEEAKLSDRVGFIRNGSMAAEESPQKILHLCDTNNMDKALLKLCESQERNESLLTSFQLASPSRELNALRPKPSSDKQKSRQIVHALLMKCLLEIASNYR
jgi:ABC-type multidrug transport system ATPase subunit